MTMFGKSKAKAPKLIPKEEPKLMPVIEEISPEQVKYQALLNGLRSVCEQLDKIIIEGERKFKNNGSGILGSRVEALREIRAQLAPLII